MPFPRPEDLKEGSLCPHDGSRLEAIFLPPPRHIYRSDISAIQEHKDAHRFLVPQKRASMRVLVLLDRRGSLGMGVRGGRVIANERVAIRASPRAAALPIAVSPIARILVAVCQVQRAIPILHRRTGSAMVRGMQNTARVHHVTCLRD